MGAGFSLVCVFLCCVNKVVLPLLQSSHVGKTVFKFAWLKSPAMMKKPSGLFVCCSLIALYSLRSASLAFAHGGM